MCQVSVLLATYRRADILRRTLAAFCNLVPPTEGWEVIVVDNADDAETRTTCQQYETQLPIQHIVCTQPGKNAALNYGLPIAKGELIVLTDDDILPEPNWLVAMLEGVERWPANGLFAGRVLPDWPVEPTEFIRAIARDPEWGRWTYSVNDPELPEGPHPTLLPIGNNMAVRRSVFDDGIRFDETIGPRGANYAMGSETELCLRLRRLGHAAVYLPDALVYHQIRPGQLTPKWLVGRAYRQGRGDARLVPDLSLYRLCQSAVHAVRATRRYVGSVIRRDREEAILTRMQRARELGRLRESLKMKLQRENREDDEQIDVARDVSINCSRVRN